MLKKQKNLNQLKRKENGKSKQQTGLDQKYHRQNPKQIFPEY